MPPIRTPCDKVCLKPPLIVYFAAALIAGGCGSSDTAGQISSGGSKAVVDPEAFYRTVGKGKNKQKVSLSRTEKRKLIFEANRKLELEGGQVIDLRSRSLLDDTFTNSFT